VNPPASAMVHTAVSGRRPGDEGGRGDAGDPVGGGGVVGHHHRPAATRHRCPTGEAVAKGRAPRVQHDGGEGGTWGAPRHGSGGAVGEGRGGDAEGGAGAGHGATDEEGGGCRGEEEEDAARGGGQRPQRPAGVATPPPQPPCGPLVGDTEPMGQLTSPKLVKLVKLVELVKPVKPSPLPQNRAGGSVIGTGFYPPGGGGSVISFASFWQGRQNMTPTKNRGEAWLLERAPFSPLDGSVIPVEG